MYTKVVSISPHWKASSCLIVTKKSLYSHISRLFSSHKTCAASTYPLLCFSFSTIQAAAEWPTNGCYGWFNTLKLTSHICACVRATVQQCVHRSCLCIKLDSAGEPFCQPSCCSILIGLLCCYPCWLTGREVTISRCLCSTDLACNSTAKRWPSCQRQKLLFMTGNFVFGGSRCKNGA